MAQTLNSAALFGSTGLVGSQILKNLVELQSPPQVYAFSRRSLPHTEPHCHAIIESDSSAWSKKLRELDPAPQAFITALGTTRAQAGSFEAQRKIDMDLNLELAQAAKEHGSTIALLISSAGTSPNSKMPYSKMKGELDLKFRELGFTHTIILRPGLLLGERDDSRPAEAVLRKIALGLGKISSSLVDFWAQNNDVIAKSAVAAVLQCAEGKQKEGVWTLEQADIIRLGRTEWKQT